MFWLEAEEGESEKAPPGGDGHATASSPFLLLVFCTCTRVHPASFSDCQVQDSNHEVHDAEPSAVNTPLPAPARCSSVSLRGPGVEGIRAQEGRWVKTSSLPGLPGWALWAGGGHWGVACSGGFREGDRGWPRLADGLCPRPCPLPCCRLPRGWPRTWALPALS